ncbi:hypothetical protein IGI04_029673 [Brassica rapa subsp. trilocularis]|uniref:Uncharacterized protein n=1 Tax=Brassica rapa subsp. trilocularis TaxID=1813537 RepID=A0ABQ7LNM0_BRACM|nr:hypothetical protein IGI04_029673 [Brassica rapa subsp. trilocularis]
MSVSPDGLMSLSFLGGFCSVKQYKEVEVLSFLMKCFWLCTVNWRFRYLSLVSASLTISCACVVLAKSSGCSMIRQLSSFPFLRLFMGLDVGA